MTHVAIVNGRTFTLTDDLMPLRADDSQIDRRWKRDLAAWRKRPVLCDDGNWYASAPDARALIGEPIHQGGVNYYNRAARV